MPVIRRSTLKNVATLIHSNKEIKTEIKSYKTVGQSFLCGVGVGDICEEIMISYVHFLRMFSRQKLFYTLL